MGRIRELLADRDWAAKCKLERIRTLFVLHNLQCERGCPSSIKTAFTTHYSMRNTVHGF